MARCSRNALGLTAPAAMPWQLTAGRFLGIPGVFPQAAHSGKCVPRCALVRGRTRRHLPGTELILVEYRCLRCGSRVYLAERRSRDSR